MPDPGQTYAERLQEALHFYEPIALEAVEAALEKVGYPDHIYKSREAASMDDSRYTQGWYVTELGTGGWIKVQPNYQDQATPEVEDRIVLADVPAEQDDARGGHD